MLFSYKPGRSITTSEIHELLGESLQGIGGHNDRILVVIPDNTRTLPMPAFFDTISRALAPRVKKLTFLVALGTHPPLSVKQLSQHLGIGWESLPVKVLQHEWGNPEVLANIGKISQEEMAELSGGLLPEPVPVEINRNVLEHDLVIILNPVFPHEVVGFSGGYKYFFPGVSGPDMVNQSHWLGALVTSPKIIGHKDTPVRRMIDRAGEMVPTHCLGISIVMRGHDLMGIFFGPVREAWSEAVALSAEVNIKWIDHPFHTVLSMAPPMYRELWVGGKCMYKLEPVVADGGTLIIYGPHILDVSITHGKWLLEIGYHTRDYYLAQFERFQHVPRAVLAHSTHVKGIGTYKNGVERPRINVVLATGIPEQVTRRINLDYRNPQSINPADFAEREKEGVLVVPDAGEVLWRLADGSVPDVDKL